MIFNKKKKEFQELWTHEFDLLAQYNTEVSHGLVHTPEWRERMKEAQEQYNLLFLSAKANSNG